MGRVMADWESWEALEECIRRDGPRVARAIHMSPSTVVKWREPIADDEMENSGARNPLDRLEIIVATIEEFAPERAYVPIKWLCARFGFLPPVKLPDGLQSDDDLMAALLEWNREFGETSQVIAETLRDRRVTRKEMERVRREVWEDVAAVMTLMRMLERRVEGCDGD